MADLDNTGDPFDAANAPGVSLIVLMRLYDVLMGLYSEQNPTKAQALMELHARGGILLPVPFFDSSVTLDEQPNNE
jgi:hypothetical protein